MHNMSSIALTITIATTSATLQFFSLVGVILLRHALNSDYRNITQVNDGNTNNNNSYRDDDSNSNNNENTKHQQESVTTLTTGNKDSVVGAGKTAILVTALVMLGLWPLPVSCRIRKMPCHQELRLDGSGLEARFGVSVVQGVSGLRFIG